jgi:hypothetical protein
MAAGRIRFIGMNITQAFARWNCRIPIQTNSPNQLANQLRQLAKHPRADPHGQKLRLEKGLDREADATLLQFSMRSQTSG